MRVRYEIAIIGSGPAGLSAAAHAAAIGLSHVLLEKADHVADTIFRYQRGKHVMATPSQLALRADLPFDAGSREAILAGWEAKLAKVELRLSADVVAVEGSTGDFVLTLADGGSIRAAAVVLAIGTQGNPNLLAVAGGEQRHVQYQLDDPQEYIDEHIVVIGSGDAGIENALGLAADPEQRNVVTLLNRGSEFARAKEANVKALFAARDEGRVTVLTRTAPASVEAGEIVLDTRDGTHRQRCDRIIARMGSTAPRGFLDKLGIAFSSADREAFPVLTPRFESSVPGLYVIGALAGYPLIKHCLNQGHDVVEFIAGNDTLKPADDPILDERLAALGRDLGVTARLDLIRARVTILNDMTTLQMREFMLDSRLVAHADGGIVFERNAPGASLFGVVDGCVEVAIPGGAAVPIMQGSIVGEVGLISGRRRGATVRARGAVVLVEIPRVAALKLMATVPAARRTIDRIAIERQLLQLFKSGLAAGDLQELVDTAELRTVPAHEAVVTEGEQSRDVYVVRSGSMVVEKVIGGKPVFLSYLPANSYFGEMALVDDAPRSATVRAAIRSEVVRLDGAAFDRLLAARPALHQRLAEDMKSRRQVNAFIEERKHRFSGVVDLYSSVASFLVDNGVGEATDVLLIDEKLCVGCDNCEKACADSHEGLSRLDREAGKTFARLHVPTSCRHCEHPHCMADCPPNAIRRGPDGEVSIDDSCIGCGNCERNCPYGVIRLDRPPPPKPRLASWLLLGRGPGPGQPSAAWSKKHGAADVPKRAVKCDMCAGIDGGPACVRACPTGAAIRVAPEAFLNIAHRDKPRG